ncbi:MAG: hypothetical protein WBZ20_09885 [Nitrososphaeraceae archaeon]
MVVNVYEIHRYQNENFQYVVARTNKNSEEHVRKDVEKMNAMLSNEMKAQGIKYVFATGSMSELIKQRGKKSKKEEQSSIL